MALPSGYSSTSLKGTVSVTSDTIVAYPVSSDGSPTLSGTITVKQISNGGNKKEVKTTKTFNGTSCIQYDDDTTFTHLIYVKASTVYGTNSKLLDKKGKSYAATKYYISNLTAGVSITNLANKTTAQATKASTKTSSTTSSSSDATTTDTTEDTGVEADVSAGATTTKITSDVVMTGDFLSNSMDGIFGLPYQWLPDTDTRLDDSEFGRMYATKIAARMPLLFLTPGTPAFMPGASDDTKANVKSTIVESLLDNGSALSSKVETAVEALLGSAEDEGCAKYYSMNFAYDDYYSYVNPMCQITAKLLGLDKKSITINKKTKSLTAFTWQDALSGDFSDYFSAVNAIPFYIDAATSVSESFNNDTTASALASAAKSASSGAKELNFLMGTASSIGKEGGLFDTVNSALDEIKSGITGVSSASRFLNNVTNGLTSIAQGGAMLFPEIWDSSSFGRSYSINIKLRSPDCDDLSIYLNELVPLYHLLGMVAPHTLNKNYNTYSSPFLVRAYCKGMFNIDMGIITSMDVSKGKEGSWNANGLPTEIDVSLTIKDLYELFSITAADTSLTKVLSSPLDIIKNTSMMDYLCNTAGVNINKAEIQRNVQIYLMLVTNNVKNWPSNKWLQFQTAVDNKLHTMFSRRSK